ncbi:hypothetical protein [Novosphingobium nitrogenifigens]|nr:hypothetical protein [Novosphingobium nitrogenifigens]
MAYNAATPVSTAVPTTIGAATGVAISSGQEPHDWHRRMSDTVAHALLVCTALQICVTMQFIDNAATSALPLVVLLVLVVGVMPLFRHYDRTWECPPPGTDHAAHFRRDRIMVWIAAIGLPFATTGIFILLGW